MKLKIKLDSVQILLYSDSYTIIPKLRAVFGYLYKVEKIADQFSGINLPYTQLYIFSQNYEKVAKICQ